MLHEGHGQGEARSASRHPGETPRCLQEGDVFVFLSLPKDAQVGCDTTAVTVQKTAAQAPEGGAFRGFRSIPPGAHLVWMASPGAMARQGCWFMTRAAPGVARVREWHPTEEVLGEPSSREEAASLVRDIDATAPVLLAYNSNINSAAAGASTRNRLSGSRPAPLPQFAMGQTDAPALASDLWPGLTSCVAEPVLGRVMGQALATSQGEWLLSTTDVAKGEVPMRSTAQRPEGAEFAFLFDKNDLDPYKLMAARDRAEARAHGSTALHGAASVDTTDQLVSLVEHLPRKDADVIGELQFAFLTGTLLSNLSCLEQWWHLVLRVFLRAHGLVSRRPGLGRAFIQALHVQLVFLDRHVAGGIPGSRRAAGAQDRESETIGIFDTKPQGEARLRAALADFKSRLDETLRKRGAAVSREEAAVGEAFVQLEASLWEYGWDLRLDGASASCAADHDGNGDDDVLVEDYDGGSLQPIQLGMGTAPAPSSAQASRAHKALSDDSDSDSDNPVLVELDEDGREVGLVSWD